MSQLQSQARLKAVRLAKNLRRLLSNARNWTALLVRHVFDRAELHRLEDPLDAWDRLRYIPPVLEKIGIGRAPEAFPTAEDKDAFALRVQALLGETATSARLDGPAEDAFAEARRLWEGGSVAGSAGAEYHQRLSFVALRAGRLVEAKRLAERGLELAEEELPELLLLVGLALNGRPGLPYLARSFRANPLRALGDTERAFYYLRLAERALSLLVRDLSPAAEEGASHVCREVEQVLAATKRPKNVANLAVPYYYRWARGLAVWGTGLDRWAVRRLDPLPERLRPHDPRAAAWVGLDLARIHVVYERPEEVVRVLEEVRRDLPEEMRPQLNGKPTLGFLREVRDRWVGEYPLPGVCAGQ